jgi:hypothetical protein
MRRLERSALTISLAVVLAAGTLSLAGCAAQKISPSSSPAGGSRAPAAEAQDAQRKKAELPREVTISLRLAPGQSWKSRFLSTSEGTWRFKGSDGKEQVKTRTVGLELVATQTVASLAGNIARIEVKESAARILRDGKFMDVPFKQFGPPDPVAFTLDIGTGKPDFSEMEKAYAAWMAGVKEGPAGEILGKAFRMEAYLDQLKELYGRPFTRFQGRKLPKGISTAAVKDFILPFLGPGVALGAIPVEVSSWYEGMEVRKESGGHLLKAAGRSAGSKDLSADELAMQLSEFGVAAPKEFRSSAEIGGQFESSVDLMTGREVRATSQFRYSTSASFDGGTVVHEIAGKSLLEPAD